MCSLSNKNHPLNGKIIVELVRGFPEVLKKPRLARTLTSTVLVQDSAL